MDPPQDSKHDLDTSICEATPHKRHCGWDNLGYLKKPIDPNYRPGYISNVKTYRVKDTFGNGSITAEHLVMGMQLMS